MAVHRGPQVGCIKTFELKSGSAEAQSPDCSKHYCPFAWAPQESYLAFTCRQRTKRYWYFTQASQRVQSCDVDCYRGQILQGTQQRLQAQTHLSAQDAAAALAAASFLDQLTSSQVRLLGRSTVHVP